MTVTVRVADRDDAQTIALLHANSWRRHYRGVYSDSYLDGDIVTDMSALWAARLATPTATRTIVAEEVTGMLGFVHVAFDDDARWGSLIDNLHVALDRQRTGLGTRLIACAADAVVAEATNGPLYLWVLECNVAAQRFYQAIGGTRVQRAPVSPLGGQPSRFVGCPHRLRFAWPDASALVKATRQPTTRR